MSPLSWDEMAVSIGPLAGAVLTLIGARILWVKVSNTPRRRELDEAIKRVRFVKLWHGAAGKISKKSDELVLQRHLHEAMETVKNIYPAESRKGQMKKH